MRRDPMHNPDDPQCYPRPTPSLFGGDFFEQPPHHCHHHRHYLFPHYPQVLTQCEFLICYLPPITLDLYF